VSSVATERPCPGCGAPVPATTGYPDWCDRCGWNLQPPPERETAGGRFARLAERAGRRSGERMARQLLKSGRLEPRWTPAKLAAFAVAGTVHLLSLALVAGGVAAIVVEFPNVVSILIGAAMVGVGLLMRPRVSRLDEAARPLDPARTPALHELVAAVAGALDRPAPDLVAVDASWNAYWNVVGLSRQRVLVLGLPLLAALEPPQRVALIAHELGHDRNGDARRSLVVGAAVGALDQLSALLQPDDRERWDELGLDWLTNGLMWIVSRPVDAVLWLEVRLLSRDMQRAEYLADAQAARAAGTAAVIALHERFLLESQFELTVQQAAQADDAAAVFARLHEALEAVPERERERRRRVARLEHARLDATHPPTALRIELLEGRPAAEPVVTLNTAWSARIDTELAPLERELARELLDAHRSALYSG
jgi:Zn-dependent protease with chaperone function